AAHPSSSVLGRGHHANPLALAAAPDRELQSARRRPRPPGDRCGAQLRFHRYLAFQPRVQKAVWLFAAYAGEPIVHYGNQSPQLGSQRQAAAVPSALSSNPMGPEFEGQRWQGSMSVNPEFSAARIAATWGEAAF